MIKRILVPTDFSKPSIDAFHFAEQLANQSNAEVHIYHVIEAPSASYDEGSFNVEGEMDLGSHEEVIFTKSLVSKVKRRVHAMASEAKHDHVKFHSHVEMGNVFKSIISTAEDHEMDIMVIGTHGAHGLGEAIVGSTAEKLVRFSPIPVIAVKTDNKDIALRDIVFASEFSENMDNVMPLVKELQTLFGSKIHLVRINTPNDFHSTRTMKNMMEEFAHKYELENYTVNTYSDIVEEDGIIYFSEDIHADMIIMPTHARKGLMHLLSGSIAEDVVNHANRPVLTVKI